MRPGTMDAGIVDEMEKDPYYAKEYLRNGDFVIDAGANIGAFALLVKRFYPDANVICLEPMPDNFAMLQKNVRNIALTMKITLIGKSGLVTMYDFGADASACHSAYDIGAKHAKTVYVEGKSLSDVIEMYKIDHLHFLKLDCQGAEFEIIPNTPHTVLMNIDYIAMEVHRSIAKTGVVLGAIPHYNTKMHRLYKHLLKTHIPVQGTNIESDSVQVWANRKLVRLGIRICFKLLYKYHRVHQLYQHLSSSVSSKLQSLLRNQW